MSSSSVRNAMAKATGLHFLGVSTVGLEVSTGHAVRICIVVPIICTLPHNWMATSSFSVLPIENTHYSVSHVLATTAQGVWTRLECLTWPSYRQGFSCTLRSTNMLTQQNQNHVIHTLAMLLGSLLPPKNIFTPPTTPHTHPRTHRCMR